MKTKEYFRKGLRGIHCHKDPEMYVWHRERGLPACEYFDGSKSYLENNRCHRLDGFAGDWKYRKAHFLNGKLLFTKKNK